MPKRGENIYKRKDGRWEGRYIRGRSPSGGAVYGYVYARSYRECRVKRQKQLEALGKAPEQAASLTLAQAAGRFLADREYSSIPCWPLLHPHPLQVAKTQRQRRSHKPAQ